MLLIRSVIKSLFSHPVPHVEEGNVLYVIGDIHGRADLLEEAIAKIEDDRALHVFDTYQEIYLGDYVDRGPESKRVLDFLIAREASTNIVPLCGNHENLMAKSFDDPETMDRWRHMGGLETMMSYGIAFALEQNADSKSELHMRWKAAVPEKHRRFLESLRYSISIDDYFFVHAGIRPGVALDRQKPEDLMWIRKEFSDSHRWHGKYVIHGHTPTLDPDIRPNRMGIDTGAYMTGRLTCLKLFEDKKKFL